MFRFVWVDTRLLFNDEEERFTWEGETVRELGIDREPERTGAALMEEAVLGTEDLVGVETELGRAEGRLTLPAFDDRIVLVAVGEVLARPPLD